MFEDFMTVVVGIVLVIFATVGLAMATQGTFDFQVVNACKNNGYWQTGQIRVICSVE